MPIEKPLHISDDIEYAAAMAEIDHLWDLVPDIPESLETPESRRLWALAEAVAAYEKERWFDQD